MFLLCYFSVYPLLPPIRPISLLQSLKKTLKDTAELYVVHNRVVNDPVAFNIAVEEYDIRNRLLAYTILINLSESSLPPLV